MKSAHYVGISLYDGQIQLAEIEHAKKTTLTALSERKTSIDFKHASQLSSSHPQLHTFVYELEELIKQNRVHTKTVSFALPIDPVFINIIPVDPTIQGSELASYVHWEFEQFHPDLPAKDFIISAQPLPDGKRKVKQILIVGVRKGIIGFLKSAVSELRLQLHLIDIDQFSSEKALQLSYPEFSKDVVALFGIRSGRMDATLMVHGEMIDHRAFVVDGHDSLRKAIIGYLLYLKQIDDIETPSKIVLHGPDVSAQTVSFMQHETGIQTLALDAVRHLSLYKKLSEPLLRESFRFAAAIGLALRTQ